MCHGQPRAEILPDFPRTFLSESTLPLVTLSYSSPRVHVFFRHFVIFRSDIRLFRLGQPPVAEASGIRPYHVLQILISYSTWPPSRRAGGKLAMCRRSGRSFGNERTKEQRRAVHDVRYHYRGRRFGRFGPGQPAVGARSKQGAFAGGRPGHAARQGAGGGARFVSRHGLP